MRDRSRNWSALDYVAVDFETTGLEPAVDEVVSMGAVPITSGRIDLSRATYAEATHNRPAHRSGVPVHGLRPVDLIDSPLRSQMERRLGEALKGRQLLAWTAWVEAAFLASMLGDSGRTWRSRIIDVRDLVLHLDRLAGSVTPQAESLVYSAVRHGVPPARAHHALGDALMTAELFLVVVKRLESRGRGRIRELKRVGSGRRQT